MDDGGTAPGLRGGYPIEQPGSWPRGAWDSAGPASTALTALFDDAFDEDGPLATTRAALVVQGGAIVLERYASSLPSFVAEPTPVEATTPLLSWSMAKSHLAVMVARLEAEGLIDLDHAPPVPEWSSPGDPRQAITWDDLLEMRDGLSFAEEYADDGDSDVIEMLYGAGKDDCAHYAAVRPLAHEPGSTFSYSSGTTNILSRSVAALLGGEAAMRAALIEQLFGPLAMRSAEPGFDAAGTFVASSFIHATAQDYARFGLMLCRGGVADGRRLLPERWVDRWRTPRSVDLEGRFYSAHLWVLGDRFGTFYASGFEGQSITVCPPLDLVIVRLGSTPHERTSELLDWRRRLIAQVADELAG